MGGDVSRPTNADPASGRNVIAVIGVDRYRAWRPLSNAVRDATSAATLFERLGFQQITAPLLDDSATGNAIQELVTDELMVLGPEDSLVLFYAGHGGTRKHDLGDQEVKTGYLIPVDASDSRNRVATWIELDGWLRAISRLRARHILVVLDACYSGIALGQVIKSRDLGSWQDEPLSTLNARRSRKIITSALDDQIALDGGPLEGHSLFTGCLIEALTHDLRRTGSRVTTGSELGLHLQKRVRTYPSSQQTPDFGTFAFDDRGEMTIPLAPQSSTAIRTTDRRERARRVLFDAYDRWLEQGCIERRLLDLETVIEIVTDIDVAVLTEEASRFFDQSAAYHITDHAGHVAAVLEFMRRTASLEAPDIRFTRLLQHSSPRLRRGAVRLVREFDRRVADQLLLAHVATEQDPDILRSVADYLRGVGVAPSTDVAEKLLARPTDWMTAAWALTGTSGKPAALLLGDGSDFAHDMASLVAGEGFRIVEEPDRSWLQHAGLKATALASSYQVILVIRGENYFRSRDDHNYDALAQYVRQGGLLFMTPWVAWETVGRPFQMILPFHHQRNSHNEGITLRPRPADTQLARELFPETFACEVSFEELAPWPDTTVLLHGDNGVPLYGFRDIERGECHYLNVCQHHCLRPMSSPLQSVEFACAMQRVWKWLRGRCERATLAGPEHIHVASHGQWHRGPPTGIPRK